MHVETTTWSPAEGWHDALPAPDGRSSLVLVVGDPAVAGQDGDPLADLWRLWHGHAVLGCSTRGHATDSDRFDGALLDVGLSVAVLRFEHTEIRHRHHEMATSGGARRACRRLAADLADPALQGVLVVGDGLRTNASSMVLGIADILPGMDVLGFTASDGDRSTETWTLIEGEPRRGWVSAVGFVGEHVVLGHGVGNGWDPSGEEHLVTSSYGNVVYSIDDAPPLELHRRARNDSVEELRRRALLEPWSVRDLDDRMMPRGVVEHDPQTGAVRCGGDVMQGADVQLLHATADGLVHAAHLAAKQAAFGREQFALVASGVARHAVLDGRSGDELEGVRQALEPGCHLLGVQSGAELSTDDARNASVTVSTIAESSR